VKSRRVYDDAPRSNRRNQISYYLEEIDVGEIVGPSL